MFVIGQSGCIRANWCYSGKSGEIIAKIGCIWAKVVVFGQSGCVRAKVVVFGPSG